MIVFVWLMMRGSYCDLYLISWHGYGKNVYGYCQITGGYCKEGLLLLPASFVSTRLCEMHMKKVKDTFGQINRTVRALTLMF